MNANIVEIFYVIDKFCKEFERVSKGIAGI